MTKLQNDYIPPMFKLKGLGRITMFLWDGRFLKASPLRLMRRIPVRIPSRGGEVVLMIRGRSVQPGEPAMHGVTGPSALFSSGGVWSILRFCHWDWRSHGIYFWTVIPGTAAITETGKDEDDGDGEGNHEVEAGLMRFLEVFG